MLYLKNDFSFNMLTQPSGIITYFRISRKEVQEKLKHQKWVSLIDSFEISEFLTKFLEIEIPLNRITVNLNPDDELILVVIPKRFPFEDLENLKDSIMFYQLYFE